MVLTLVKTRKIPVVDVLLVILISGVVGMLAFPSGPGASHRDLVATVAMELDQAVHASHENWLQDGANLQDWNGIELSLNQLGWPAGGTNRSVSSVLDCEMVWRAFLGDKVTAAASPVTDYRVSRDGQTCFYSYSGDVRQSRMIQYSADTGRVQVLNP